VFFDMDRFKHLVDTHGHVRGSAALAEVGRWLHTELAPDEVGCRFGGDEFALLFPGADRRGAETRCAELEARLVSRTFLDDEGIHATLGASFGVAAFPSTADRRRLLHLADCPHVRLETRPQARAWLGVVFKSARTSGWWGRGGALPAADQTTTGPARRTFAEAALTRSSHGRRKRSPTPPAIGAARCGKNPEFRSVLAAGFLGGSFLSRIALAAVVVGWAMACGGR
jgi:diguanylate cyclase (GGDEF)-like protein